MRTIAGIAALLLCQTGAQAQNIVSTHIVHSAAPTPAPAEMAAPTQATVATQAPMPMATVPTPATVPAPAAAPTRSAVETQPAVPTRAAVQAQAVVPAQTGPQVDKMRFTITRNDEPIGTQAIEINRAGAETSVSVATDLSVKVMFITAYRFEQTEKERWVNGKLVGLTSATNANGERHEVQVTANATGLDVKADGKVSRVDQNIMPASFWNPELLARPTLLDTQAGKTAPLTVRDNGMEDLKIKTQVVKARHYTVSSMFSQDLWYDSQARLVQSKMVASDGSVIMYRPR
jgi:hypothetical protein